ncbi:MAG: hypothetical protein COZ06_38750 [Armatimonadetes bacterium CG_4_10_14_3_um_filter_66_18]|nr:MAG: hypothetical protein COS65_19665 [Armatimonadetes bacterium CG06_land_8_20_14_3_00_66_21]PIX41577.1 MAG: hypothetical protein COZ57_23025 [Armatimonadetes bacterium CG_4_8_14_3_um_filter_66_20]PIY35121.1 MAG: hypothetical protein COZ06_38750 [Armatimonadetes bacterium CG_4_10_14_3_um_filter_66_18]PIZ35609.1 MAG: hypothetical protein COY42_26455 [Armatimonadetes bacterium CG_4_10_14_0_8_um_filter_66_14]
MKRTPNQAAVLSALSVLQVLAVLPVLAAPLTSELSGYGRLALSVESGAAGSGVATFTCQDAQHADRLLSKLRADFAWDKLSEVRAITLPGGAPALAVGARGVLVFARRDKAVYVLSAPTADAAQPLLARRGLAKATFLPQKPHPLSLDFFDLRPVSMYYLGMNVRDMEKGWKRYDREPLGRTADFWAKSGYGYSRFLPYFGSDELADGAGHTFPMEYCVKLAVARGQIVMNHFGLHWAPWWMRNRFPRDIIQWDPNAISGWNPLEAMAGTYLSQFASDQAFAYSQRFAAQALDRLHATAGDNLGCIRAVGGGHPGDEMGLHHLSTEFMDYGEAGQAAFRQWLRDTRKLDLPALSQRWYGDANHLKSWDDVTLPSNYEFFGAFGDNSLDLRQGWLWRPDRQTAEEEGWQKPDYAPGDEWTPTDLAPSMKQLFLFGSTRDKELREGKSTVAWFRKEFDPSAWLAKNRGRRVYVVAQVGDSQTQPVGVFLNDAYLGPIKPKTVWCGPIAFDATALVKPGRNVLCLKVQDGIIRGPVFLTTEQPKRYPYLGPQGNARWIDLRDWEAEKLARGWKREARFVREKDPDTPFMFVPGGSKEFWDHFLELKTELGISSLHHTGGGSSYMPWWSGLGYVWGAYGTSEEGGTSWAAPTLSRELAWMLLDAQGHHNYYYDAWDYVRIEEKTQWFSKNARLLDLLGKSTWEKPPVAVLRAARTDNYFPYSAFADDWDLGRSSLQAAHYQNVYVTEAELRAGLADDYPVVFDSGSLVLGDEALAALERYVRAGGTFVAVNVTGRHTPLEADAWPIQKLTGFQVLGERENMHVTVLPDNPLLKHLAGMTFDGNGIAVNWMGVNHLADGAVALGPQEGDGTVLARWEDGTAAVGMRRLGKGRVIVLGSSFWRSMSDRAGNGISLNGSVQTTFFGDLFAGLGIRRQADVDSEDVWVRRLVTKNGLEDWVMAYNAGRGAVKGRTLSFPAATKPAAVRGVETGKPVPFTWAEGAVRVPDIDLDLNAVKVFAIARRGLLGAVEHWFSEKRHYETRPVVAKSAESRTPLPAPTSVLLNAFRFRPADAGAKTDLAWLSEPVDGAAWKDLGYGFWDELGYPAKGVGLYRCTFRAPAQWQGPRVLLACVSFDYPVFLEHATFFVNGKPAGEYQGHPWANFDVLDITPSLKEGDNDLGVLVEASEVRGGYLGQLVAFPLENLQDARDLTADWKLYADNQKWTPATVPLDATGRYLETEVTIPATWKNDSVFLEWEVSDRWVGLVVVNGRAIAYNAFLHPYGNLMQVNLYPFIKPGEVNRIELWGRSPSEIAQQRMVVKSVRLGTVSEVS